MRLGFTTHYLQLPSQFYSLAAPEPAPAPRLVIFNSALAQDLNLDAAAVEAAAAQMFSGNALPEDAAPLAMAYAGHQFGHFVPLLGDGRALLLGELQSKDGRVRDVHLKGSGRTPYSRGGDGRAVIGPMLREYLISEAMHALGIPTTRSLAVIATGQGVRREELMPGAILVRVAASHVRVGTFQYFAARGDVEGLRALLGFSLARHYAAATTAENPALEFLHLVCERQAKLIAQWMLVGFIHGVMNTDNMAVSGETIDYGPCAFMDSYDPNTVFSSIDRHGRYAYANQPTIAQWNLARLAETLLPLIHADTQTAVAMATASVNEFMDRFDAHFLAGMRRKLGLTLAQDEDPQLVTTLLQYLRSSSADFTSFFAELANLPGNPTAAAALAGQFQNATDIQQWLDNWRLRCAKESIPDAARAASMAQTNPFVIPRNHLVEAALRSANEGDMAPFQQLLAAVTTPFNTNWRGTAFSQPALPHERVLATFCGT